MKILIHAPSRDSLKRARLEAARLVALPNEDTVRIVATLEGAVAAVQEPHTTDPLLVLCGDSLADAGLEFPRGAEIATNGTELVARLQGSGWRYVHG